MSELKNCKDCFAVPGSPHISGCDVERCSVCGNQWIQCGHKKHDPVFARWTGIWPGLAEANFLGLDMNGLYVKGFNKVLFVKPLAKAEKAEKEEEEE